MGCDTLSPAKRNAAADILKIIACVCVVVIHTASESMTALEFGSFNWYSAVFWGCLCRFAVPVFLMVTGALLLDPAKDIPCSRIYKKYLPRVLFCLFFWSILYEIFMLAGNAALHGDFSITYLKDALIRLLKFEHHFQLYYLHILIIFYVFLPLLRLISKNADKKTLEYILILWFVTGIVLPYFYTLPPLSGIIGIPLQYPLPMVYSSLGYALMGYYLKEEAKKEKALSYALIFLLGFAIVFLGTVLPSHDQNLYQGLINGFTPGVALMAFGVFAFVHAKLEDAQKIDSMLCARLAKPTFCIYLCHHFFVMIFLVILPNFCKTLCAVTIPLQAAVTILLSLAVYFVMNKIPWLREHAI